MSKARARRTAAQPQMTSPEQRSPNRRIVIAAVAVIGIIAVAGWYAWSTRGDTKTPHWDIKVIKSYPHDESAFTQGLVWDNGAFLEGTGKFGQSELRRVEMQTGKVLEQRSLPDEWFGEGVAVANQRVFQLTWQQGKARVYHHDSLEIEKDLEYDGQGWGLAFDGRHLIMSDGTSTIRFRDPGDFHVVRSIQVRDGNWPVSKLNELEFVDGAIYANVWYQDRIAVIDPQNGSVRAWIDISQIAKDEPPDNVPNGIAYDARSRRLFVTGKNWSRLYQIEVQR